MKLSGNRPIRSWQNIRLSNRTFHLLHYIVYLIAKQREPQHSVASRSIRPVLATGSQQKHIGTLMNTRGLMELVALNIGYEMGVLPPSIFVILVIMALVTTFMTTPLLHLVERIFARREERLSAKLKLVFCFGRPESGRSLLSIFFLLFGKKMKAAQVVAAHFTVGTDLNPLNAEQYARDSFSLVDEKASELGLSVENRYRVTDKLLQDRIGRLPESFIIRIKKEEMNLCSPFQHTFAIR